jgi:outer membrane protein assembly factor BamD (BamD/ComL family)
MDWKVAKEKCLLPLIKKFPEGRYAEKADLLIVDIDKRTTDKEMHSAKRLKQGPANEAEKLLLAAEYYLKFGDRVTALRKFRSITQLFKTHDEFRFYVLLAQDQVDAIVKSGGADEDYVLYLNKRLKEADSLFKQGKQTEAEEIWTSIRTLYKENEEVRAHVSFATKRLNRDEVGTPPWVDTEPVP